MIFLHVGWLVAAVFSACLAFVAGRLGGGTSIDMGDALGLIGSAIGSAIAVIGAFLISRDPIRRQRRTDANRLLLILTPVVAELAQSRERWAEIKNAYQDDRENLPGVAGHYFLYAGSIVLHKIEEIGVFTRLMDACIEPMLSATSHAQDAAGKGNLLLGERYSRGTVRLIEDGEKGLVSIEENLKTIEAAALRYSEAHWFDSWSWA